MANRFWNIINTDNVVVKQVWSEGYLPDDFEEGVWIETPTQESTVGGTYDGITFSDPLISIEELREARDALIESVDWITTRHRDEVAAGLPNTSITEGKYQEWLLYKQELRDVTQGYVPTTGQALSWPTRPSL